MSTENTESKMNTYDKNEADGLTDIVTLSDENGNDVDFEFLDLIEYKGESYVVLIPTDDDNVVILKVEMDENGEETGYVGVDNKELLVTLFEIFKKNNAEFYDFTE